MFVPHVEGYAPHTLHMFSTNMDWEELEEEKEQEDRELDWDADIEDARDYRVRVPVRRPRQLPKVLIFQTTRPPIGWPSEVRSVTSPKPDLVPKSANNTNPKPEG